MDEPRKKGRKRKYDGESKVISFRVEKEYYENHKARLRASVEELIKKEIEQGKRHRAKNPFKTIDAFSNEVDVSKKQKPKPEEKSKKKPEEKPKGEPNAEVKAESKIELKVETLIVCPTCNKSKRIYVPTSVIDKSKKALTPINIKEGIVCEHRFQAYIDKRYEIQRYQTSDTDYQTPNGTENERNLHS